MTKEAHERARASVVETPAARQITVLRETAEIVERLDPESAESFARLSRHGVPPNSAKELDRFGAYLAEAVAVLARQVEELVEASKPKPRGRPRKDG